MRSKVDYIECVGVLMDYNWSLISGYSEGANEGPFGKCGTNERESVGG